jgi:hypothetical protein
VAKIEGCGTVLFNCKNGEHRSFAGVYYIPRLTSNIISIGQLDEAGYKINIDNGVLRIREQSRRLLARVPRRPDRLYVLDLDVARPVCLAARGKEEAWRWHARMGHVNMSVLRKLAREEMVRGLPPIEQMDQLCDACLTGKQRRNSFRRWRGTGPSAHWRSCTATYVGPSHRQHRAVGGSSCCLWATRAGSCGCR